MNGREFWALNTLSNDELEASPSGLLGAGVRVEARIVAHLAEVEARRLHLLAGFSSLYDYCRKRVGLTDYEAFARLAAARVASRYPLVLGMLARRELHLTAICEVREFLSDENHVELLTQVSGKTKLQIREVLARRFPQADIPTSLTKLPSFEPLSPGRYRLLLTLSAEQKAKLELARDLLSHANSNLDLSAVVERALDELIARLEKRRFGQASLGRRTPRSREDQVVADTPALGIATASTQAPEVARENTDAPGVARENTDAPSVATESSGAPDAAIENVPERTVTKAPPRRRHHIAHDIRRHC